MHRARRIVVEPCCKRECLLTHGYESGVSIALQCFAELEGLTPKEKKIYMLEKVRACITGKSSKGYFKFNWKIGSQPGLVMDRVCRVCFCRAYGCGLTYVEVLIAKLKIGDRNSEKALSDARPAVNSAFVKNLKALATVYDIELTPLQIAALVVPNTVASLTCFAWMQAFFDAVGDQQPNHAEIHLEPTDIKVVHSEYHQVIGDAGEPVLEYHSFLNLWETCFPHVKIREFKAVTGKCKTCTLLSEARRKQLSLAGRRYLTELHALHRTMYMGERLKYYDRRNEAMLMPRLYWSGIGDGMMQAHCVLPHRGNMVAFPQTLPQHLQGLIAHGRSVEIYRTFHNVPVTSNLATHCLLLALEKIKREEGRVPDTVYYQIDGGPENTANAVFGIAELTIVRGLTKRVVITRLPVGHTHEDIDSKFAVIWKRIRNKFILSPIQYLREIEVALTTDRTPCNVHDIFIVPDYAAYIVPFLDPNIGRYAKRHKDTDWTQLQFEFVAVPRSDSFPLGSRMTYRKYSQDQVLLIEASDTEGSLGFKLLRGEVKAQPEAVPPHVPLGMFVLRELPTDGLQLRPEPFIAGSRSSLEKVVDCIQRTFAKHLPEVVDEWITFRDEMCPQDDDAERFVREKGMYIPFQQELFSGAPVEPRLDDVVGGVGDTAATDIAFTASMRWSGRGAEREKVSNVPYTGDAEAAPTVAVGARVPPAALSRKRQQERSPSVSSASSSDEPSFEYLELSASDSGAVNYVKYIGRIFDDDEDGGTFKIISVCDMRKVGARRSTNTVFAFKYIDVSGDPEDFLYTPVREMLNSYWCKWKTNAPQRSARGDRGGDTTAGCTRTALSSLASSSSSSSRAATRRSNN